MDIETQIINYLKSQFPNHIGDDAVLLENNNNLISKDILIEDIHFRLKYFTPQELAHKSIHVNLSDIAAMGGTPHSILLGIGIPSQQIQYAEEYLKEFIVICNKLSIKLIGGDTTKSPDKLYLSITILGHNKGKKIIYRNGAKNNNLICVAGNLGYAHLGLLQLEQNLIANYHHDYSDYLKKPTARIDEGLFFNNCDGINAMMDISDGLCTDLEKLADSSNKQAIINLDLFNFLDENFKITCGELNINPLNTALIGGEDYSLLITINQNQYTEIVTDFYNQFGYKIKQIGYISNGNGIKFIKNNKLISYKYMPFAHFK
ncbi:MAG: thiamine-phosphate kinase [Anaplasmataceae bacterium]|nr:thiamine-phosphate kinase [Anaplasmataceae bacterium]